MNYYAGSHKNRGQEQLGFRDTWTESSSFINIVWGDEEMKELENQSLALGC